MENDNLKNNQTAPESEIEVMPREFYGGMKKSPQTRVEQVFLPAISGQLPAIGRQQAVAGGQQPTAVGQPTVVSGQPRTGSRRPGAGLPPGVGAKLQQPKTIILLVSLLLAVVVGIATFYYVRQAQQVKRRISDQQPATGNQPPAISNQQSAVSSQSSAESREPQIESRPQPPVAPPPPAVILPQKNYTTSLDSDNDGLTDAEETIYGTGLQMPDTDTDGYPDALELLNLYNPTGFKPEKLIDSGLVKNYFNPNFNYSIYYPAKWVAQALDTTGEEVMLSSDTGEFVQISLADNPENLALKDWYLAQSPGANLADLEMVKTKEGVEGILSPDGLTAYIPFGARVYVINYNIGLKTEINFLSSFKMMSASFKTAGTQEAGGVTVSPPVPETPAMETTTTP